MESIISLGLGDQEEEPGGTHSLCIALFFKRNLSLEDFELPVSRKEIADLISMSSANVIRTFSEFRRDGIIRANGRTIEITDMNKLEVISRRG